MTHGNRLLIVDDDAATRSALVQLLTVAGFQCSEAGTYQDAVAQLQASAPDLLVTDVRLGLYNGLQLLLNRPRDIPAVVLTGFPDPVLAGEAQRQGAVYVQKPVNPRDLVDLIRHRLSAGSQARDSAPL
jgi:DNA-binding NtrC family response regulator